MSANQVSDLFHRSIQIPHYTCIDWKSPAPNFQTQLSSIQIDDRDGVIYLGQIFKFDIDSQVQKQAVDSAVGVAYGR